MANIKFSQFTQKTTLGTVDFLVGYTGAQNIQIDPVDLLSGYSQGTGAAGQVTFFSAASTVTGDNNLYWDNTNKKLGIGTSTPSNILEVKTTLGAANVVGIFNGTMRLQLGLNNNAGAFMFVQQAYALRLGTGNTERMRVTAGGDVGIGTTTPVAKLHVEGSFISSGISQLGTTGANVLLTSSSAGNVGIGTSSPTDKLDIAGAARFTSNITFDSGKAGRIYKASNHGLAIHGVTGTENDFAMFTPTGMLKIVVPTGTNNLILNRDNGNVGIGTSNPTNKLHIQSSDNAATANLVYLENIGSGGGEGVSIKFNPMFNAESMIASNREGAVANASNLTFHTYNNAINEAMRITSSGNVGIGTTSPGRDLQVGDGSSDSVIAIVGPGSGLSQLALGDNADDNYAQILLDNSNNKLQIQNGGGGTLADRGITLDSSENVGIGTASPESKLTIKGDPGNTNQPVRITNVTTDAKTGLFINGTANAVNEKYGMQFGGYNEYSIGGIFGVLDSTAGSTSGDITFDFGNGIAAGDLIEKVRFTHEGNVGIGTTSPSAPLGFGKSIYGDVDTDAFYRVKFQDQGGVANDVGIGQTETGGLGFNITSGKKYTFSTGTSGTLLELSSVSASFLNIPKIILKLSTNNTRASFDGSGNYLNIRAADNDTSKPQMWLGNGTDEGIYANAAIHYWRDTSSNNYATLSSDGLDVKQGDVEVETSSNGLILKSPDGTRYRIRVANGGTLSVSAV